MYKNLSFDFDNAKYEQINNLIKNSDIKPAISEFTLHRTYSRNKYNDEGEYVEKESKYDIYLRVTRGTFSILKDHLMSIDKWQDYECKIQDQAYEFFRLMWQDKVTPPGRGLWTMGTELVNKDLMSLSLVNCSFISSRHILGMKQEFFAFVMDALMLGVGVGFDDEGANKLLIRCPIKSYFNKYDKYHDRVFELKEMANVSKHMDNNGVKYIMHEADYVNYVSSYHKHYIIVHQIQDSRDGWVNALRALLRSYFKGSYITIFDYSQVRPAGRYLKKFGGVASGPLPLCEMFSTIRYIMNKRINEHLSSLDIIDICNLIARTVIAGNVRRSSEICVSKNMEVLEAKNYSNPKYSYRMMWGWASNNSYIVDGNDLDEDILAKLMETIATNGEPGIFFRKNSRVMGRAIDPKQYIDFMISGTNPCGEISLEGDNYELAYTILQLLKNVDISIDENKYISVINRFIENETLFPLLRSAYIKCNPDNLEEIMKLIDAVEIRINEIRETEILNEPTDDPYSVGGETCNLVETIPSNFDNDKEYFDSLYYAVLYCKIVTLLPVHWKGTDSIQRRNRRIGVSQTGIMLYLQKINYDLDKYAKFCDIGYKRAREYDNIISEFLDIPRSIKITTVKPSGTTSIRCNVTSGMHAPMSEYYIRRIRYGNDHVDWTNVFLAAGYNVEPDVMQPTSTMIVSFPVKVGDNIPTKDTFSVEEQFKLLKVLQTYWSDNQVSCTVDFTKSDIPKLPKLLMEYKDYLKGITFMPRNDANYAQLPMEKIDKQKYIEMSKDLKYINFDNFTIIERIEEETDNLCDGESCMYKRR